MTPSLFDLPVRTGEAALVANLVMEIAGSKPLSDEVRNRIGSRASTLKLETTRPHFGSLERDPIHASAIYLAIDGIGGVPLLLRIAPAATPSSGLFPKSILIARVPGASGQELVINAIPFGPSDEETIRTFAEKVNRSFQPKRTGGTAGEFPANPEAAFREFRAIQKARGQNVAAFHDPVTGVWAAIRTGWREGWTLIPSE